MKLSEFIHRVWEDERIKKSKIRKSDVKIVIEVMIDKVSEVLMEGRSVKLRKLFTVELRRVKGRNITDLNTKKKMKIDDYYKVALKPSDNLKALLKKYSNRQK